MLILVSIYPFMLEIFSMKYRWIANIGEISVLQLGIFSMNWRYYRNIAVIPETYEIKYPYWIINYLLYKILVLKGQKFLLYTGVIFSKCSSFNVRHYCILVLTTLYIQCYIVHTASIFSQYRFATVIYSLYLIYYMEIYILYKNKWIYLF